MARPSALSLPDPDDDLTPVRINPHPFPGVASVTWNPSTTWDPSAAVVPFSSSTFNGAAVTVNVTLQMVPPAEALDKPTRHSRGRAPRAWFQDDKYVCTCEKDSFLCIHIQAALLEAQEVGRFAATSLSRLGQKKKIFIPLTNEVLVPFELTVRAHPIVSGESLLEAVDQEEAGGVSAMLTRDDGLLILVNKLRDWYRSTIIFDQVSTKIVNKKRLPCRHSRHGHQNDVDLVSDIKAALRSVPESLLVESDDPNDLLRQVCEEVVLNNTYYLIRKGMCYSCHSYTVVSPDDIPSI